MSGGRSDQLDVSGALLDLTNRVRALEATPTFFGIKQVDCATYVGDPVPVSIATGANSIFFDFAGLEANSKDVFKLKGGSSPYTADILGGFYYWQVQIAFSDNPPPFLLPNGTDPTIFNDFGLMDFGPVWNARTITPFAEFVMVVPGETVPFSTVQAVSDGFFDLPNPVDDMEVSVGLRYVQNPGSSIQNCQLFLARLSHVGLTDESTNIVP